MKEPDARAGSGRARLHEAFSFNRTITRNLQVKVLSELGVKGGRFVLVVIAARLLGQERFGLYAFAGSFAAILATMADFGLQLHLTREIARGGSGAVLRAASRAKFALTLLSVGVLLAGAMFYPRPEVRGLLLLAGAVLITQSWCEFWNAYFRGRQRLAEEARLGLLLVGIGSILGITFLLRGGGVIAVYAALLAAALITHVVAYLRVRRDLRAREPEARRLAEIAEPAARWQDEARRSLRNAAPIGLAILLSTIYFRIDMVILERCRSDAEVGAYGAAYRILESLLFLPALFAAAIYPAFAESTRAPRAEMRRLFRTTLRWMMSLSALLGVGLFLFAREAIQLLYGDAYADAVPLLRLLAPSLLFIFSNYALTHFLVASGEQRWNAVLAAICVPLNIGLNLLFVPTHGAAAAAVVTALTEGTITISAWILASRRIARQSEVAPT